MRKSVILNDNQVNRLQQTGSVAVVEMVPEKYLLHQTLLKYGRFGVDDKTCEQAEKEWNNIIHFAPYTPGSTVYVREAWMYVMIEHAHDLLEGRRDNNQFCLRSQYNSDFIEYASEKYGYSWQSPATMPRSAARLFPIVDKVEVVRCRSVNAEQRIDIGLDIQNFTDGSKGGKINSILEKLHHIDSFKDYITSKFGQSFWDENGFLWLTTLKLEK